MANPEFENLKHLQNLGHLLLTGGSITGKYIIYTQEQPTFHKQW